MDVLQELINRLDRLPPGDHSSGLKEVRRHIEAAIRHFKNGQDGEDDAFRDVIYRCNQAFEGSLKEAYRVLTSENPEWITPAQIEKFLTSKNYLGKRVIDQLTNYRMQWRNPATHDHKENFYEDEALIAIVSVTAFSIALCAQIENQLAFLAAQSTAPIVPLPAGSSLDQVAELVRRFSKDYFPASTPEPDWDQMPQIASRAEGALAGYLSAELSTHNMSVTANVRFQVYESTRHVDLVVQTADAMIAVDLLVKRGPAMPRLRSNVDATLYRMRELVECGNVSGAVVSILLLRARDYEIVEPVRGDNRIKLISPLAPKIASK